MMRPANDSAQVRSPVPSAQGGRSAGLPDNFLIAMELPLRRPVQLAMNTWRFLAALSLLTGGLYASPPPAIEQAMPERLLPQLDGVLKGAVQQSPRMLNRALDLEIAENNRIQAHANLLPSIGGNFSYYQASDDRADLSGRQNVTKIAYNFSVTQPIFHWGERRNNDRIGEIQLQMSKGAYRDGYRMLAQELRNTYMHLVVQKLGVKRARFYLDFANNQLKQQEERLAKKVISEVEISAARLNAEQAQISLERAEYDLVNAKASFARLAGRPVLEDDAIPDEIPATTYAADAFDQLLAGFLAQKDPVSLEAYNLRHQLEIENLNYANTKTRLRPKFNAVLGTSQDEQSYSINVANKYKVNSIYGGISVSWSIFDGFSTGAAVRNELARRRQLENDYHQLTERLAQDAQTQVKQINFSARNMAIYDRFLVAGAGYLQTVRNDFQRGAKSEMDVSQAQLNLFDAQINAANARSDFLYKVGDFLGLVMDDPVLANLAEK